MASGIIDPHFIGHCCEIKESIKFELKKQIPPKKHCKKRYDGHLHIPQLHILIDTPHVDFVDIHGLGKENNTSITGLLHGVVGSQCSIECHDMNVIPDGTLCNMEPDIVKLITFKDIYDWLLTGAA